MSEYKRQVAAGMVIAVVAAVVLGLGVSTYFPSGGGTVETLTSLATSTSQSVATTVVQTTSNVPSTSIAASSSALSSTSLLSTVGASSTVAMSSSATTTANETFASSSTPAVSSSSSASSSAPPSATTSAALSSSITQCAGCNELQVLSANLTVKSSGPSTLSLAVSNDGGMDALNLTIYLGTTELLVIPRLAPANQTQASIQVPPGLSIQVGRSYQVAVQGQYGQVQVRSAVNVTATAA